MSVAMLVLSGSIGTGKTTLLGEVTELLVERGFAFTAIDIDATTQVFPRPVDDPYGMRLAADNLAALWGNARARGAERLVLASVVESRDELASLVAAVPGAEPFVVLLETPDEDRAARIRRREIGSARRWHLERAIDLARILRAAGVEDVVVASDTRPVRQIAQEVLELAGWI